MFSASVGLNFLLTLIIFCLPQMMELTRVVLLNNNWKKRELVLQEGFIGLFFSIFLIFFLKKKIFRQSRSEFKHLTSLILLSLANLLFTVFGFTKKFGFFSIFLISIIQGILRKFALILTLVSTIGKFVTFMPKYFEITGVNIIIFICNLGSIFSEELMLREVDYYRIKPGYFERILYPSCLNFGISVFLILACPLFLIWRVKKDEEVRLDKSIKVDPSFIHQVEIKK